MQKFPREKHAQPDVQHLNFTRHRQRPLGHFYPSKASMALYGSQLVVMVPYPRFLSRPDTKSYPQTSLTEAMGQVGTIFLNQRSPLPETSSQIRPMELMGSEMHLFAERLSIAARPAEALRCCSIFVHFVIRIAHLNFSAVRQRPSMR